ncbi:DUF3540 domain-containing protein [Chondromyces crocatus]|uniref:DUF3540 domain-containing protein n=1 Tax=Chondromyces crocatus TaxID=52 RepID=A0A0K1EP67_CHOCO|nr:DUF3540 domain-containing protein [Chondromyces crocatus]AKT42452.1 uncharacterized protein CMC5_066780 [Chondromyces crocatus]
MQNLAKKLEPAVEAMQRSGYVVRVEGPTCTIRWENIEYRARRAVSCLVDPELGDRVLFTVIEDGSAWVLAILEREEDTPAAVSLDRDLTIRVPNGRFDVVTSEGVGMTTTGDVSVVSRGVEVTAAVGRLGLDRLTMAARELLAEVSTAKVLAGSIDSVLDRVSQKVKRAYRVVEEMDHLRTKRADWSAEKSLHLHAENAIVSATGVVKVDGEHIHLG